MLNLDVRRITEHPHGGAGGKPPSTEKYAPDFYTLYANYLLEPRVRAQHDKVFAMARLEPAFDKVADLGCGRSQEFFHYAKPSQYVGIDLNIELKAPENKDVGPHLILGNYRDLDLLIPVLKTHRPTAAVSLFSAEIIRPASENYSFYEEIFRRSDIQAMLVAGFYYFDRKGINPVQESGGVTSYQTLEAPEHFVSRQFSETRITLPVPSNLFGETVYEVWKILNRRAPRP